MLRVGDDLPILVEVPERRAACVREAGIASADIRPRTDEHAVECRDTQEPRRPVDAGDQQVGLLVTDLCAGGRAADLLDASGERPSRRRICRGLGQRPALIEPVLL